MNPEKDTWFAPAGRTTPDELKRLSAHLGLQGILRSMINAVPGILLILDQHRQIVLANESLFRVIGGASFEKILGLRPGEALDCIHARDEPDGCGTTEFCRTCGAAKSLISAAAGVADVQECRILQRSGGDALDFRVYATPLTIAGEKVTVFFLDDISSENRRRVLERVFFHDVLNTAGGIRMGIQVLPMVDEAERQEMLGMLQRVSDRLIDEIQAQRDLASAESGELILHAQPCDPLMLLNRVAEIYRAHKVGKGRTVVVEKPEAMPVIIVDGTLLGRVIGNMTKNALEAVQEGETVTLACRRDGDFIVFWVHNPGCMPRDVELQVFQRSFSTKGTGRGLGTYSIKLLTERYLGGSVWFTTHELLGTTFFASIPLAPAKSQEE